MNILPEWLGKILAPNPSPSLGSSVITVFAVMALGIIIGKIKVRKVSLGISGVMFAGILLGHYGYSLDEHVTGFLRDLGLILFVYAVGMQMGPSFFSSFRKDGIKYNALAVGTILGSGFITLGLFYTSGLGMDHLVGIMSGAVTNTPGLGAAKVALEELSERNPAKLFNDPANAYAITYPFGVLSLILIIGLCKKLFGININQEIEQFEKNIRKQHPTPNAVKCRVTNPEFFNKSIAAFHFSTGNKVIVSRIRHSGSTIVDSPSHDTIIQERDVMMLVGLPEDINAAVNMLGRVSTDKFIESEDITHTRIFVVTKNTAVQKTIEELDLEDQIGVTATRVYRSGLEMLASPSVILHYGDKIKVVGDEKSLEKMANLVGNSAKDLQEPQLLSIFLGVVFGVVAGSIPLMLPGLAAPVKLGISAGPLLVALLISRYGGIRTIHSFLNQSAILFMKDFGICLFFAVVGISAGRNFIDTFIQFNGWGWVIYGLIITLIPLLAMIMFARWVLNINFIPLLGIMSGTYTDPAALAFGQNYYKTDLPTQAYATVYPLATIMRILVAQLLVLYFAG